MKNTKPINHSEEDPPVPASVLFLAGLAMVLVFILIVGIVLIIKSIQSQP